MKTKRVVAETTPEPIINYVKIRSLVDAHFTYIGRESGEQYEWKNAGAISSVDERDVPELLTKRLGGKTCCGGSDGNLIFEVVGD